MKKITLDEFMALPVGSVSGSVDKRDQKVKLVSVVQENAIKFKYPRATRTFLKMIERMRGEFITFEGIVPVKPEDVWRFDREHDTIFVAGLEKTNSLLLVVDSFQAPHETRPLFRLLNAIDFEMNDLARDYYAQIEEQFDSSKEALIWMTEPNPATGDDPPLRYFKVGMYDWVLEVAKHGLEADYRNLNY